jgi:hypothetical protein
MTSQFRGKFSFNIRLTAGLVFVTASVFILALAFGVAGYAQTPPPLPSGVSRMTIIRPTPAPTNTVPAVRTLISGGNPLLANHTPLLGPIGNKRVAPAQNLSFTLYATDADHDRLSYNASGLPSGATFDATTRAFSWTPRVDQTGTFNNLVFEVTDGRGGTASETIAITVAQSNTLLAPIGNKTVKAGTQLDFGIFIDLSDVHLSPMGYGVSNVPPGAICPTGNSGIDHGEPVWFGESPEFQWKPTSSQVGNYTVTFSVAPATGEVVSETITITVTP